METLRSRLVRILVAALVLAGFSHQALGFCFQHPPKCQAEWSHSQGNHAKDCAHQCGSHPALDPQPLLAPAVQPPWFCTTVRPEAVRAGPERENPGVFLPPRAA